MSSVLNRPRPINPETAAELVRVGHIGDAPAEPVRLSRVKSPSQAEAAAEATARRCAGPRESLSPYQVGAYQALYAELYQHYLDAMASTERAKHALDYWPDECPELDGVAGTAEYNS
jgi:hypothetical protein